MSHNISRPAKHAGFTLIEVLVGLVIGIISMTVVLQTFSASEASKRTTTGGDDAQVAGALSLFTIERDMKQAGYGISSAGILNCQMTLNATGGGKTLTIGPVTINPSASIIPAGDTGSDTLLIMYGNTNGPTEGNLITANATTNVYTMQSMAGWTVKDYVTAVHVPPSTPAGAQLCTTSTLDTIKTVPTSTGNTNLTVNTGTGSLMQPNLYSLFDLGLAPVIVGYRVFNGSLTTCNYIKADCSKTTSWSEVSSNIASMHAVYGHDSGPVGAMTGVTGVWDQTPITSTCAWLRTQAVAIALVARNTTAVNAVSQNSNNGAVSMTSTSYVTTQAPQWQEPIWSAGTLTWAGAAATYIPMDLSANAGIPSASGLTWQNYRYRLYSTVVPLHNITWLGQNSGSGC